MSIKKQYILGLIILFTLTLGASAKTNQEKLSYQTESTRAVGGPIGAITMWL